MKRIVALWTPFNRFACQISLCLVGNALALLTLTQSVLFMPLLAVLALGALVIFANLERLFRYSRGVLFRLYGAAFLIGGQLLIFRPTLLSPSLIGYALMLIGLLIIALTRIPTSENAEPLTSAAPSVNFDARWLVLGIAASIVCAWRSTQIASTLECLLWWLLALIAVGCAFAPRVHFGALKWRELVLPLSLFLVALAIRATALNQVPALYDQDEARFAIDAVKGDQYAFSPFATDFLGYPRLYAALIAASVSLFGPTLAAARLVSAPLGALGVPAVYALGREIGGWRVGLAAALFMLIWPFHVQFSRLSMNQMGDALCMTLAFWFLLRGLRREQAIDFALSGICLGAAQLFYFTARFALVPFAASIALTWRFRARHWQLIGGLTIAAMITGLPQHIYLLHFHIPLSQRSVEFVLFNESFGQAFQRDPFGVLIDQTQRAVLALFSYPPDTAGWYGDSSNLMGPVGGALLWAGVTISLGRRQRRMLIPLIWALGAVIFGGVLTISPPQFQRYVAGSGALAVLVGLGLVYLTEQLPRPKSVLILTAFAVCAVNGAFYVGAYVPEQRYLFNRPNLVMNSIARLALAEVDAGRQVIIVGEVPTSVGPSNIVDYLLTGHRPRLVMEPFTADVVNALPPRATLIVAPTRLAEVQARLPGIIPQLVRIDRLIGYADSLGYYVLRLP